MISNFEIPSYAEGFDEIKIIQNYPTIYDYTDAYMSMRGFDQKNPHHALDLMRHCEKCQDYVLQQNDILDVIPENGTCPAFIMTQMQIVCEMYYYTCYDILDLLIKNVSFTCSNKF